MANTLTLYEARDIMREDQRLFEKIVAGLKNKKETRPPISTHRQVLRKKKSCACFSVIC
jgi:hypothetical protein